MTEKAKERNTQHASKSMKTRIKTADAILGAVLLALSVCGIAGLVHHNSANFAACSASSKAAL